MCLTTLCCKMNSPKFSDGRKMLCSKWRVTITMNMLLNKKLFVHSQNKYYAQLSIQPLFLFSEYKDVGNFFQPSENQCNIQQIRERGRNLHIKLKKRHHHTLLIWWLSSTKTTVTEEHITMEIHCWMIALIKPTHKRTWARMHFRPPLSKPFFRHESALHEFAWLPKLP